MPILISINSKQDWIFPKADWKSKPLESENSTIDVDPNFYIEVKKL